MNKFVVACLMAGLSAGAVCAQDMTGLYAGVTLGTGDGDITGQSSGFVFGVGGESYGIYAGYLAQSGQFAYGAELAYQSADITLDGASSQGIDRLIDLKGRVGYVAGPTLIYGVLGYSKNRIFVDDGENTSDGDGLSYGLGVDYQIGERYLLGAEYLRRDMENAQTGGVDGAESDISTFSLRLGLKF